jgi:hypothetical protein
VIGNGSGHVPVAGLNAAGSVGQGGLEIGGSSLGLVKARFGEEEYLAGDVHSDLEVFDE